MRLPLKSLLFFLLLHSGITSAFTEKLSLKAGAGAGSMSIRPTGGHSKKWGTHMALNSHFSYRWTRFEIVFSSHIFVGRLGNDYFYNIGPYELHTTDTYRQVAFGPGLRYHFGEVFKTKWAPYIGIGAHYSLTTFEAEFLSNEGLSEEVEPKLLFRSAGLQAVLGLEQELPKKDFPLYIELTYNFYRKIDRTSIVDKQDSAKVEDITNIEEGDRVLNHSIFLSVGLTFL